jgi:hypothetical protein
MAGFVWFCFFRTLQLSEARRSRRSRSGLLLRDFLLVHLIEVLLAAVA